MKEISRRRINGKSADLGRPNTYLFITKSILPSFEVIVLKETEIFDAFARHPVLSTKKEL